jgi:hypothetical protein
VLTLQLLQIPFELFRHIVCVDPANRAFILMIDNLSEVILACTPRPTVGKEKKLLIPPYSPQLADGG